MNVSPVKSRNAERGQADHGCSSCTLYLVKLCYGRSIWFPLFREPLVAGMKLLGRLHGIVYSAIEGPNKECKGCLRYLKNSLKEHSPLFVFLNGLVNPVFNSLRDSLLDRDEKRIAKDFAAGSCAEPFTESPMLGRATPKGSQE